MRLLLAALVGFGSLGASKCSALGFKLPTKCNIPISYRQVFDYIHSFAEFQKHILHYVEHKGFADYAPEHKKSFVKVMRTLSSKMEDRLLGDDFKQTRQALLFYADSLRMVRIYQRVHKMLDDEETLVELLKIWEPTVKTTLQSNKKINAKNKARMLKSVEATLVSAKVESKMIDATLSEFSHLTTLANEMCANPTFVLFRAAHESTAKSDKVEQLAGVVRQAALLSLIHHRTTGEPTESDFDRSVRKILGR